MEEAPQDVALKQLIAQMGPQGALAILAYGYRAVEIWRELYPINIPLPKQTNNPNPIIPPSTNTTNA